MDKQNITVLRKILYAVESGDQVYGKQDYSCFFCKVIVKFLCYYINYYGSII